MSQSVKPVQSVVRAFDILNIISKQKWISLAELSREIGLHKSTVYGLLSTLESQGFVFKNPTTSKYQLTLKLYHIGSAALNDLDVTQIAHPHLEELVEIHEETAHLVLPDEYEVIYVDKVESQNSIRICSQVGKRMPFYCTGVGKAILAFQPQEVIDKVLSYTRLIPHTKKTITSYTDLLEEFAKIRTVGYAIDNEEVEEGLYCIAAPIHDMNGNVIAAMSVAGPTVRMTKENTDAIIKDVLRISATISERLGYCK